LDAGATEQLAQLVARAGLPIDVASRRAEHAARKAAALEARLAKATEHDARFSELERTVADDPEDREAYLVLADYLQGQGDPRGELIVLQLRGEDDPRAHKAAQKYFDVHHEAMLGPLVPHQKVHGHRAADAFTWRRGYIQRARLSTLEDEERSAAELLELVLRLPSGRFLAELTIGFDGSFDSGLERIVELLAEHGAPALRKLHLGDFVYPDECELSWFEVGDISGVWRALPRLRHLIVQGGTFDLGTIEHPTLERLEVRTGGLSAVNAAALTAARCPALRHLDVWYGTENYGWDGSFAAVEPLLARTDLPALRHLGLRNAEFTDEACRALVTSPLLRQLEVLDLSLGTLSDDGAQTLAAHRDALRHLRVLDVSKSFLTDAGRAVLRGICAQVIDTEQQDADDGYRYPSVGE
ncbi:MAG: TIGR02996 domain-containing protein, partial [Myxococcota bacterium]|nr:TIGR02996 domain-containing protein [Myxococcota bacterium]